MFQAEVKENLPSEFRAQIGFLTTLDKEMCILLITLATVVSNASNIISLFGVLMIKRAHRHFSYLKLGART